MHAVTALEAVPFARRIVVKDGTELDYAARGYDVVRNPRPQDGLSLSVRLGVQAARGDGIDAIVIALADMPRITAMHIYRLFGARHGPDTVVASSDGVRPRPPVLFGSGRFDALEALTGDSGARDMILAGRHVIASPEELVDVDTEEELRALREKFGR
jgi:molybdenum cofactor cytidylyltransferase